VIFALRLMQPAEGRIEGGEERGPLQAQREVTWRERPGTEKQTRAGKALAERCKAT
jgi:hypothetical protein